MIVVAALAAALAATELCFRFLLRIGRRWADRSITIMVARRCWWPARILLPAVVCDLTLPLARLPAPSYEVIQHGVVLTIIAAAAWMVVSLSFALEDTASARYRLDVRDNLRARRVQTRVGVIRRLTVGVVSVLALAAMLTTFEGARAMGTTLLASAGIVGVVVGVAARPTVSNLVAGLQIFFSEPLRVDDVVVIEGEWGRVEEIRLTYIVVRLWDERRLVVPLMYILDHPFQNWTRQTSHIMAAVYMAADYTTPVDDLRQELGRILEASELWDRRFWNLQVTDVTKDSIEVRALMTAQDATAAWDLRCEVREKLLSYVQLAHPNALPRRRVSVAERARHDERNGLGGRVTIG
jgi:small-conductance mechanosensitive channel